MVAIMQPYKAHAVFSIQCCQFNSTCFTGFVVWYHRGHQHERYDSSEVAKHLSIVVLSFIVAVATILPLFYISFVTLQWMSCQRKFTQKMIGQVCVWIRGNTRQTITDVEESLPGRLVNPAEYEEGLTDPVALQFQDNSTEANDERRTVFCVTHT